MVFFLLLIMLGIYFLLKSYYENLEIVSSFAYIVAIVFTLIFIIGVGGRFIRWIQPINIFEQNLEDPNVHFIHPDAIGVDELDDLFEQAPLPRNKLSIEEILAKFNKTDILQDNAQDGDCGVCYEGLDDTSFKLLSCPKCHKSAHKPCIRKWIESGQSICIYCRHDFNL